VLPDEGHARFAMTGLVDGRDLENPEFDFSMSADVLIEPFIVQAAGSARLADNSLYARVEDMPAMFEPYYEAEGLAPIGTWMLLGTTEELGLTGNDTGLSPLQNIPTVPMILNAAPTITPIMSELQAALSQLPPAVATSPETMMASLASIEFREGIDGPKIISLLEQYPPLVITGDPELVKTEDGDLYEYEVVPSLANLLSFVREMPQAIAELDSQQTIEAAEALTSEFPTQAELDEALQYFDMFLVVTPAGDFDSFSIRGEVTESADTKSKLSYALTYGLKAAPGQTISVPADVHPGSVIGEQIKKQEEQRAIRLESSTRLALGNARMQAEIFFSGNQFSYSGFCEDIAADFRYRRYELDCVTSPDGEAYRISTVLPTSENRFCVDSTGFSDEVALVPDGTQACTSGSSNSQSSRSSPTTQPRDAAPSDHVIITNQDRIRGNPNADLFIIEYCDYLSLFCKRFHETLLQVIDTYGVSGEVAWVYRQFPLEDLHPLALDVAIAAECVGEVSGTMGFWEFTDKIYQLDTGAINSAPGLINEIAAGATGNDYAAY
jgi:hypothetical protein